MVRIITLDEGGAEIITLLATRRKMHASIVTSDYQKVDGYIRSLAIVPRTVLDAHSAVGFVHYLRKNKNNVKTRARQTVDTPERSLNKCQYA